MSPDATVQRRHFLARALAALTGGWWLARGRAADAAPAATQFDDPYLGEIRMFAGDFAPYGWFFCDGSLLPISQYNDLFNLIGTTYGGDGQFTFALPDLRSRAPVHVGTTWVLGMAAGQETVTLTPSQMPAHSHVAAAATASGASDDPGGRVPARNAAGAPHFGGGIDTNLSPGAMVASGGSTPHNNMQPFLGIHFIICWSGVYPSPS